MRIPSLFGLRAMCISFVLVAHLSGTRHFIHSGVLELYGNLGSRIFFVLSGFLITSQLLREHERTGTISLKNFYIRRAYRIFPAAYIFMAAIIALNWDCLSSANIIAALTYCLNFYRGQWVLGHLWSLGVEEQFYVMWPLVLLLSFEKRGLVVALTIAAVPTLRMLLWVITGHAPTGRQFPLYMDALAVGCALALVQTHLLRHWKLFQAPWFAVVPIATVLLPLIQLWNTRLYQAAGITMLHFCIALSLQHVMVRPYKILNWKPVAWFGSITYSLYLWQQLFLDRASHAFWAAFPLNLVLALACGTLSYYIIEQPFLKLREKRAPKGKTQKLAVRVETQAVA
ncbi:MAG TPA: acyltransferase [Terriglobales bacterium]|jgi:peptidoglycan/LPS O-acetylase OafA/YrhL|nr:acyltransferase [Terriglobales bacterium]